MTVRPLLCLLAALAASNPLRSEAAVGDRPIPPITGLGSHRRPITHASARAQQYFDQGMAFYYGFNAGSALRSFGEAEKSSPDCAMVHWALALAYGPNINTPMKDSAVAPAWQEIQTASRLASTASPVEQAIIRALAARYLEKPPADRSTLDEAYAVAMRAAWKEFPADADVGVLFADALMNLRPWDQWTIEGKAQPGTEEIVATLDAALRLDISHPYANHLYIHALEASPYPERAIPAADRLLVLQPALAHNVHMPSHIYIRVGRWQDAIDSNLAAVAAHARMEAIVGRAVAALSTYNAHDEHMLAYAAMMIGQSKLASAHAQAAFDCLSDTSRADLDTGGYFRMAPVEVMIRFGRWHEILAIREATSPLPVYPVFRSYLHAARSIAFAATEDLKSARVEQAEFLASLPGVPNGPDSFSLNRSAAVMSALAVTLEGELEVREGNVAEGIATLQKAVTVQDLLAYDEPPAFLIPARHSLGAALLNSGRYAEAEAVYREDLRRLPNNGWSLYGLATTLNHERKVEEAVAITDRFHRVWSHADVMIDTSCLCQAPSPPRL